MPTKLKMREDFDSCESFKDDITPKKVQTIKMTKISVLH